MNPLRRFFSRPPARVALRPLVTDEPVVLVGDVHGCADLLDALLAATSGMGRTICVGDYIDRGEESAKVVARLMAAGDTCECLLGNHESMILNFLDAPRERGGLWLRNGGLQTLASYRVGGVTDSATPERLARAAGELREAMGPETIAWLRNLPLWQRTGNLGIAHAAADPALPLERQPEGTLLWGHRDFGRMPRADGLWIAIGHRITQTPGIGEGVIQLDSGAYVTGRLTALVLDGPTRRLVQAVRRGSRILIEEFAL